jgi:hypothetical protein
MRTDLHSNQRTLMAEAKISGFTVFSTAKFVRKKTRADLPKSQLEPEWRHPGDNVCKKTRADFIENLPLDKKMIAAYAKKENGQPTMRTYPSAVRQV